MNKNFSDAKEHFINKGYCSFDLSEFDTEFLEFIYKYLICDNLDNLNEVFLKGRFDAVEHETTFIVKTAEERENVKQTLIDKYDYLTEEGNPNVTQCWFWTHMEEMANYLNISEDYLRSYLENKIYKILEYFYDLPENTKIDNEELKFTLYNKDCIFTQHSDGIGVNYCSMIIYLNKDYNKEDGGLLLLDDEYVIPEIGTVALMDLSKHNVRHGVSRVTGGPGRFAILAFPIVKE